MSAALPPTFNKGLLLAIKSKGRVVKGTEQMRCRAVRFARGDGKFASNAATPHQNASAGDSLPPHKNIKTLVTLAANNTNGLFKLCLLYTSPSPRD